MKIPILQKLESPMRGKQYLFLTTTASRTRIWLVKYIQALPHSPMVAYTAVRSKAVNLLMLTIHCSLLLFFVCDDVESFFCVTIILLRLREHCRLGAIVI